MLTPRQEKFIEGIAAGMSATQAYLAAGFRCDPDNAGTLSSKLRKKPHIAARLHALEEASLARAAATRDRLVTWLWDAVQTPVGDIDEAHPLAQEVARDFRSGEVCRSRVKAVGKMDAAKLLVTLLGWSGPEKEKPPSLTDLLGPSPITPPDDKL